MWKLLLQNLVYRWREFRTRPKYQYVDHVIDKIASIKADE